MTYLSKSGSIGLVIALSFVSSTTAEDLFFVASLTGPAESPPNNSPGAGQSIVSIDLDANTMRWQVDYEDLVAPSTGVHIHLPTAEPGTGVADGATPHPPPSDFPLAVTAGMYDRTFNLLDSGTYNMYYLAVHGNSVSAARNAFVSALREGRAYLNLHSQAYLNGEIRGFYLTDPVTDFNRDGVVNGPDLGVWRSVAFIASVADANDDNLSDGADFLLWQRQLGDAAKLPSVSLVPEPRAVWLFAFALLALLMTQKKKPGQACRSARLLKLAA